ncbi:MAG: response regulator [Alphaproteobacteria bacterium]|nr:response regulator [Alphaproteobacteria bacterium]
MDVSEIPILVVDDEPTSRLFAIKILRRLGFGIIHEAGDGQEALEILQTVKTAFVVCDLHMRPMDGLTFLTHLRRSDSSLLKGMPVIMVTSEMRSEAVKVSEKLGAVAYVVKPTSRLEMKSAVEKALGVTMDPV